MPFKNWCSIHARWSKSSLKVSICFHDIFPSLKQNFIAYSSSKVSSRPDGIFEIRQLWQSGFSRVYSNCCCSCSFEPEIKIIGQSSHMMDSNNILNFYESTTIFNACTKVWKLTEFTTYISIYIYIYIYIYSEGEYGIHCWWGRLLVCQPQSYFWQQDSAPYYTNTRTQCWLSENFFYHITPNIWWDLLRLKQLSSVSEYHTKCLLDFLVMVIQFIK